VSLHPDYVMTHIMTPLSVDRTHVECAWAFPREVADTNDEDGVHPVREPRR
jgi:Rieske 2Fe-2S family protein